MQHFHWILLSPLFHRHNFHFFCSWFFILFGMLHFSIKSIVAGMSDTLSLFGLNREFFAVFFFFCFVWTLPTNCAWHGKTANNFQILNKHLFVDTRKYANFSSTKQKWYKINRHLFLVVFFCLCLLCPKYLWNFGMTTSSIPLWNREEKKNAFKYLKAPK